MYLPLVGLLLVVIELLFAANANRRRLAVGILAYSLVCAVLTHERAKVWNTDISFWSNVTSQSPEKVRGYAHLAYAYLRQRRCTEAIDLVARAPEGVRRAPEVLSVVGHAYSCKGRMRDAIDAFERAAAEGPGPGRVLTLAQIYRRAGRVRDAEIAERQALMLPPRTPYDFAMLDAFNRANEQERSRSSDR
jgi:Flp pilus assembly protein TadD